MKEIPDEVHSKIQELCAVGDSHAQAQDFPKALESYWAAWDLTPEPKTEFDAATWILAAIVDVNFCRKDYTAGRDNLSNAIACPGGLGNPFLHLRLGQCQFELV